MRKKPPITFSDLAESDEFAEFFRMMWNLAGVVIALVEPDEKAEKVYFTREMMCPVCQIIKASEMGVRACDKSSRFYCALARKTRNPVHYKCHAGLVDFVVPVFVEGCHVATIEGGQMLTAPPSQAGFADLCKRTKRYGLDQKTLRGAYFQASAISAEKLESVLALVRLFAGYFCEAGWRLRQARGRNPRKDIAQAREYIRTHYSDPIPLAEAARQAHLSPAYFSTVFKQEVGMSFTEYVQKTRIAKARQLLKNTGRSITDIAFSVGFANLTHFNYVFRKLENCAPGHLRKTRDG